MSKGGKGVRVVFSNESDTALWKARSAKAAKQDSSVSDGILTRLHQCQIIVSLNFSPASQSGR